MARQAGETWTEDTLVRTGGLGWARLGVVRFLVTDVSGERMSVFGHSPTCTPVISPPTFAMAVTPISG